MQKGISVITSLKEMLNRDDIKNRFSRVLGSKAPQFMASLVNVVANSPALSKCNANSIMAAAFVAASFDLPIDANLGFAAIVPYAKNVKDPKTGNWEKVDIAQFQMMTRGFIQLGVRTGLYERIYSSVVYEDEIVSYNPITGECQFVNDFRSTSQRRTGAKDKIAGFHAWFKLLSGYKQEFYMSKEEMIVHAKMYSSAYRYDLSSGKNVSPWSTNFEAMGKKTVTKQLLSHWGPLSVAMQKAIAEDQKTFDINGMSEYGDNRPDDPKNVVTLDVGNKVEDFDITK